MPGNEKKIYLLFSAHDTGEGGLLIANILKQNNTKASFFFTGDFLRDVQFRPIINNLKKDGHYISTHSDKHLLYADWGKRDSTLITKKEFLEDLNQSFATLKKLGITKGKWFLPPYEWYNKEIVQWSKEQGLTVINFTPGTGTNADYTFPEMKNYRSSDQLMQQLFQVEAERGLSGNLLLLHLGTDEKRTDKFYNRLDEMIKRLKSLGYSFARLP